MSRLNNNGFMLKPEMYSQKEWYDMYIKVVQEYQEKDKEIERLKEENKHIFANVNDDELLISNAMNYAEAQDYKSRCEKTNWWLKEMLKQAKSDETKAIINGTLELLLNGDEKSE